MTTRSPLYDRADFFEAYSRLPRSVYGLDMAPEWPALSRLLPEMSGLRVVDLGCGFGWFCRWARAQGATSILGLDASERMLARAAQATADRAIEYRRLDLEALDLPETAFDLAYSSLAMHYIENLRGCFDAVARSLAAGRFVFSMEHPVFTAPTRPGWITGTGGRRVWPLDRYSVEGPRITDWLAPGVIKHHRTLGTILALLIRAGFTVSALEEFCPTEQQIAAHPELEEERDRPMFLLISARL